MCTEMHMLLDFLIPDILTGYSKFAGDWQQVILKDLDLVFFTQLPTQ